MREPHKTPAKTPSPDVQPGKTGKSKSSDSGQGGLTGAQLVEVFKAGSKAFTAAAEVAEEKERTIQRVSSDLRAMHVSDNEVELARIALEKELAGLGFQYRQLDERDRRGEENHGVRMAELARRERMAQAILQIRQEQGRALTAEELAFLAQLYGPPKA